MVDFIKKIFFYYFNKSVNWFLNPFESSENIKKKNVLIIKISNF